MKIDNRGRPKKKALASNWPPHIDAALVPDIIKWDASSKNGRWYVYQKDETGKRRKITVAHRGADLGELKAVASLYEGRQSVGGSLGDVIDIMFADPDYKILAPSTRKLHEFSRSVLDSYKPGIGNMSITEIPLHLWDAPLINVMLKTISISNGPSSAKKAWELARKAFNFALAYGHFRGAHPGVRGTIIMPSQRGKNNRPHSMDVVEKVIAYAKRRGALSLGEKGKHPWWMWLAIEIPYLARLRGVEVRELTDAHILDEGLLCCRHKGSRTTLATWTPRLREAIESAQKDREATWRRLGRATPIKAEDRYLLVGERNGLPIKDSTWATAWQRFIKAAIRDKIIAKDERFSPHGMKHQGITDVPGGREAKMAAGGHISPQMADHYDHSIPRAPATA